MNEARGLLQLAVDKGMQVEPQIGVFKVFLIRACNGAHMRNEPFHGIEHGREIVALTLVQVTVEIGTSLVAHGTQA